MILEHSDTYFIIYKMRLYLFSPSSSLGPFDIEGHILITLNLIVHVVLEVTREDSWSNMMTMFLERKDIRFYKEDKLNREDLN